MMDSNEKSPEEEASYIYCVIELDKEEVLKNFGVDGKDVYTVPCGDICAVVSRCSSKPYQSNNGELVFRWFTQHEQVVDYFFDRYDAVLPFAFDTIIKGSDREVENWLKAEHSKLREKMEKIRGKQEFGAQIFFDPKPFLEEIQEKSVGYRKIMTEVESKPRGLAYMYEQRLKELMKKELEDRMEAYARDFYKAVQSRVDEMKIERVKRSEEDQQMLMNISCLISKNRVAELAGELDRINSLRNFSVKFTGPWPAYSFMT